MKKILINILKNLLFLALGVFIFWLVYRKTEVEEIKQAFKSDINYFWIGASVFFAIMSQVSRAIRWLMLIRPLGYKPRFSNTFLSILVLYLANLFVPRAGEIARCSVLTATDKVPFSKLVGTVVVERLADVIMLAFLTLVILTTNLGMVSEFFEYHPDLLPDYEVLFSTRNIILGIIILLIFVFGAVWLFRKYVKSKKKDNSVVTKFMEGIKSISKLEHKGRFIGHTAFIFLMWLIMLYCAFLAYGPTENLSLRAGMVTFLMGGIAMLLPIQGGIGPWHWMVYQVLVLYGIPIEQGKIFAFIAHTTTALVYIPLGAIALLILFFINQGKIKLKAEEKS